ASQHTQEVLRQLAGAVSSLQGEWQGPAYQRFANDFQQVHVQHLQSAAGLEQLGHLLDQAAAKLHEADHRSA
ncbi:unnamed protein product, partial [Phaeothamnion confervicola]